MLLLESVYLFFGLLAVYAYSEARRLGLLEDVPVDESARLRLRHGQLLAVLKSKLSNIDLLQLQPDQIAYHSQGKCCRLWVHQDSLYFEREQSGVEFLHRLERGGRLEFRRSGSQISVEVSSIEKPGPGHDFALMIPLQPSSLRD